MTAKWWTRTILCGALIWAAASAYSAAQTSRPEEGAGAGGEMPADLQQMRRTLTDAGAPQAQRDEMARRLVQHQGAAASAIIQESLENAGDPMAQLAAARALATDPNPSPGFVQDLLALHGNANRALTEAAALALANYRDNKLILKRLTDFARSAQQKDGLRVATIRAMGNLTDKAAAEAMMEIMGRSDDSNAVRNAAADAMADMTGQRDFNHDVQRWQQWWNANAGMNQANWQAQLVNRRAAMFGQLQLQYLQLVGELDAVLMEQFQATPAAQQSDTLLRYLQSGQPEIRVVGARIVLKMRQEPRDPSKAVAQRLAEMIADSSPAVRVEVVRAMRALSELPPGAMKQLLAQLGDEADADVRVQIAQALGTIDSLEVIGPLIKQLDDSSIAAAESAAAALKARGPSLREKDPKLAHEAAVKLRETIERRTGGPGTAGLRETCVEALGTLKDGEMMGFLSTLLPQRETMRVRREAVKALGELGDQRAADVVVGMLGDPEGGVRLEAVKALGKVGPPVTANALAKLMDPAVESDSSVREAAWMVLQSFLPGLPREQLHTWADRFKEEPSRRLIVLEVLADLQQKAGDLEQLAITRQNAGATLMQVKRPADAAVRFGQALDFWTGKKVENMVTEGLIEQRLTALLEAKQYSEVGRFAEQLFATGKRGYQQTVGAQVRKKVEVLEKDGELQDALQLIEEAKKIKPALEDPYASDLKDAEANVRRKMAEKGLTPTTSPHSRGAGFQPAGQGRFF